MSQIFISHVEEDAQIALDIAQGLEAAGYRTWYYERDSDPGLSYLLQIDRALLDSQIVVLIISPQSIRSPQVTQEVVLAHESRKPFLPVLCGISHAEFQEQQPDWRVALGATASILVPSQGVSAVLPRLLRGIEKLEKPKMLKEPQQVEQARSPGRFSRPNWKWYDWSLPPFPLRLPTFQPRDVWLGAAAPASVSRNSKFVARFTAYISEYRRHVVAVVEAEAPASKSLLDLHACQWEIGTQVTVLLSAQDLRVETSPQSFVWNGRWIVLRFDVAVPKSIQKTWVVLKFDVRIEGLTVARLRPEVRITADAQDSKAEEVLAELKAPDTAFASYASHDRREVLGRVRSLQIFTRIDVFLNCLSICPGEQWKDKIKREISRRDIFWLFWSRSAKESGWVEWEWRTALADKTISAIQPHPLEPPDIASPPEELAALQFGTLYESFLSQLKSNWLDRRIVQARKVARRVVESPRLIGLLLVLFLAFIATLWILAKVLPS